MASKWKPFNGEYEKEFYDIKLTNGTIYKFCYPNAGFFCCYMNNNKEVPLSDVIAVRVLTDKDLEKHLNTSPNMS